ncbi:hypothetical protein C0Q70_13340 [Pomacea canaliculata]|uniref:Uncharacterized protein n=1 Tax=Pomacea canaliculata TaxID=400727 RepID=A0A2T7NWY1_POMCA|nr:hypothetical protein C0Q70_13340 [Pomacea canaliculata]
MMPQVLLGMSVDMEYEHQSAMVLMRREYNSEKRGNSPSDNSPREYKREQVCNRWDMFRQRSE